MDAPRALVFRPLVKGNDVLRTRLRGRTQRRIPHITERWVVSVQAICEAATRKCLVFRRPRYLQLVDSHVALARVHKGFFKVTDFLAKERLLAVYGSHGLFTNFKLEK